jgi:enamine deaminase RidA (YjgF/YER057c/UK114 family)
MPTVEERLAAMGLTVHEVVPPVAAYVPAVVSGRYVYTSGQLPFVDGKIAETGKVGADVTPERANELAAICALNAIAAVKSVRPLESVVRASPASPASSTAPATSCSRRSARPARTRAQPSGSRCCRSMHPLRSSSSSRCLTSSGRRGAACVHGHPPA